MNRERVTFELNTPQLLTLEFDPPPSPRPGKFGEQYMYWLADNLTLWAEPLLHAKIKATGAEAGDQILVTKRKERTQAGGNAVAWSVQRVSPAEVEKARAALAAGADLANALPPPPRSATKRLPPSRPVDRRFPAEKFAGPGSAEAPSRATMAAALREAMDACKAVGFECHPEDVRALAITIYIQHCGGKR